MGEYGVPKKPESRIVLSLDQMSRARATKIAEEAAGLVWGFKVHDLLFHYGAEIVYELSRFGKVIADARLFGSIHEMNTCIEIFRTAGADIITVLNGPGYVGCDLDHLASFDCDDANDEHYCELRGYGWCVRGAKFNFLHNTGTDLYIIGRPLIEAENLVEAIEKTNAEISGEPMA